MYEEGGGEEGVMERDVKREEGDRGEGGLIQTASEGLAVYFFLTFSENGSAAVETIEAAQYQISARARI